MLLQNIQGLYINLDDRIERNEKMKQLIKKYSLNLQRFPAIKHNNGKIGCALSHINCLTIAKKFNLEMLLICEDDIYIKDFEQLNKNLEIFMNDINDWNIIKLSSINKLHKIIKPNIYCKSLASETTGCYIVNKNYYDKLISLYYNCIINLQKKDTTLLAIDMMWNFETHDNWYVILPLNVFQYNSYSDTHKRDFAIEQYNQIFDYSKQIQCSEEELKFYIKLTRNNSKK